MHAAGGAVLGENPVDSRVEKNLASMRFDETHKGVADGLGAAFGTSGRLTPPVEITPPPMTLRSRTTPIED